MFLTDVLTNKMVSEYRIFRLALKEIAPMGVRCMSETKSYLAIYSHDHAIYKVVGTAPVEVPSTALGRTVRKKTRRLGSYIAKSDIESVARALYSHTKAEF